MMKKIAFLAVTMLPSIALAHPGHSHAGMSSTHHLSSLGIFAAIAIGGIVLSRLVRSKR